MADQWRLYGKLRPAGMHRSVTVKVQVKLPGGWDTKVSGALTIPQYLELREGLRRSGMDIIIDTMPPDLR